MTDRIKTLAASLFGGALLLGAAVPATAASLVTNGGFSTCGPTATACTTGILTSPYGNTPEPASTPTGWTTTSTYSFLIAPSAINPTTGVLTTPAPFADGSGLNQIQLNFPALSPDGGNFLIQDGALAGTDFAGAVSQSLTGLNVGGVYTVGFYQAASEQLNAGNGNVPGPTTEQWQVSLGGETEASTLITNPTANAFTGWTYDTLNFVATSANEVLSFAATGAGAPPFIALDGVTVTQAVPEPATYALFGVGLLGVLLIRRRAARRS